MKIGGIVENRDLTLYRINALRDEPGTAGSALQAFAKAGINLEYITESACKDGRAILAFCVKNGDIEKVDRYIEDQKENEDFIGFMKTGGVCVIGIYGPHFREKHSIAATFFKQLGDAGVNIMGVSSSISSVCCILSEAQREEAMKAINDFYELP